MRENNSVIKKLHAFGLLDLMLALSVSAVVIVLSINYYSNVTRGQKINQTIVQIRAIDSAMVAVVATNSTVSPPPTSNDIQSAVKAMVSPSTLLSVWNRSPITFTTPTSMSVTSPQLNGNSCLGFSITVTGLPLTPKNQLQNALSNKFMTNFPRTATSLPTISAGGKTMVFSLCIQ